MNNTKDFYNGMNDLYEKAMKENYNIEFNDFVSPITVIAIHGGGIEGGTTEVARELSKLGKYKFFSFKGLIDDELDSSENLKLHVTSNKFTNKMCMDMIVDSCSVISIHGADESNELTYVGGRNYLHKEFIKYELKLAGFEVPNKIRIGLEGYSVNNICNKNYKNGGVQLELSKGLRKLMFGDDWRTKIGRSKPNVYFHKYIYAIHIGTQKYLSSL